MEKEENYSGRSFCIHNGSLSKGPVVYWMSRDQRVDDNWALLYASRLASVNSASLAVVFCLTTSFLNASIRQYGFMIKGLEELARNLKQKNIPFYLLHGDPGEMISQFLVQYKVRILITDFDPLRIKRIWKKKVAANTKSTIITVDAHNIVPAFKVSEKAEFGAYTLRPKIKKALPHFLYAFPTLENQKHTDSFEWIDYDWKAIMANPDIDHTVSEVKDIRPGEQAAKVALTDFLKNKIIQYPVLKNDPNETATSGLSPYLHFGNISAQRIVLEVMSQYPSHPAVESFLEELIVRRELSDNFCLYNPNYDSFEGFASWAKTTLNEHRQDEREFLYTFNQFEQAATHDDLWNAAQMEMKQTGKMHGYMRMYWAKKILEWSPSPEEALKTAISLNDKYELDGRDPNGYAGCAWSIGGTHDRAWNSHPVYGKIRYMNENGCRRKFDVSKYIRNNSTSSD